MITFGVDMDPHSLTLDQNGKRIGFLQWHPGKEPHIITWTGPGTSLTLSELESLVERLKKETGR
jgi:hypothetical protein